MSVATVIRLPHPSGRLLGDAIDRARRRASPPAITCRLMRTADDIVRARAPWLYADDMEPPDAYSWHGLDGDEWAEHSLW